MCLCFFEALEHSIHKLTLILYICHKFYKNKVHNVD